MNGPDELPDWDESLERERYDEWQALLAEDPGYQNFLDSVDALNQLEEAEIHDRHR